MLRKFRSVWLLAAISAIAMSAIPLMVLIGSIIGTELAPSERWATLPIAMMVIGTALGVLPATQIMQRYGRKTGFALFILLGIGACVLLSQALAMQSFVVFCMAACLLGTTAAAMHQIRFAAMECVPLDDGPTAASIIMCAGIIAAIVGPELALAGEHLTNVQYQGSYLLGIACLLIAGALLMFYQPAEVRVTQQAKSGRSSALLIRNPTIMLAVVSGASAFAVMSFVMTATPISMHVHEGHSLADTKWVIQSHITAMFLPSLITPWLFRLVGIRGLMLAGLACYTATIAIGIANVSVLGFWGQLVMLGIGWNFLFVSGTALLPLGYRDGEQYRAQSLNDSVVFSIQALAALSAGWAISTISWQAILLLCSIPMGVLAGLLLVQHRASLQRQYQGRCR
jgi:MFS family permease